MAIDDSYTKVLLHFAGTNNSTTFTDESAKTWTARGNAVISTTEKRFGAASGLFDGNGDWIDTPDSDDFYLDDGSNSTSWTIDFWTRWDVDPGTNTEGFCGQLTNGDNYFYFQLDNNTLRFANKNTSAGENIIITNSFNPAANTWYHIALVKAGTTGYLMFVNGQQIGTTQTDTDSMVNRTGVFTIGASKTGSTTFQYFSGNIDEFRLSKGVARWTTNFIPFGQQYTYSSNFLAFF